jgi:hypothetical protein
MVTLYANPWVSLMVTLYANPCERWGWNENRTFGLGARGREER